MSTYGLEVRTPGGTIISATLSKFRIRFMDHIYLAIQINTKWEDFSSSAYPDPIYGWQVPTIGYGMTRWPGGRQVQQGDVISKEEALRIVKSTVETSDLILNKEIPLYSKLTAHQKAAILSFAYNCGNYFFGRNGFVSISSLLSSPDLWKSRNYVIQQFIKYRKGAELGLGRRRYSEALMWVDSMDPLEAYKAAYRDIQDERDIKTLENLPPFPTPVVPSPKPPELNSPPTPTTIIQSPVMPQPVPSSPLTFWQRLSKFLGF
jgi:GH24 family phage-related lysozyme (muramidase)